MLVSLQDHTYPKIHHETITAEGGIQAYFVAGFFGGIGNEVSGVLRDAINGP